LSFFRVRRGVSRMFGKLLFCHGWLVARLIVLDSLTGKFYLF
jgi:hypothetical protein